MMVKITWATCIKWESLFELFNHSTKWNTDTGDAWKNWLCFSQVINSQSWEEKQQRLKALLWPCGHCGKTKWIQRLTNTAWLIFLKFNVEIDQILNDFHPRYGFLSVPLQEAKHLYSRGMHMAQIHYQLVTFYKNQGIKLFNLTSKTQFVLHSLFNARWLHPSLVWCYKGEDQMQRVAKLWKSCLEGSKHWQVAKRAVWKERHLLFLRNKVGWEKKGVSQWSVLSYLCNFTSFITCEIYHHMSYLCCPSYFLY